jgi:hypothetical protein
MEGAAVEIEAIYRTRAQVFRRSVTAFIGGVNRWDQPPFG